jgi:hypothetical protein
MKYEMVTGTRKVQHIRMNRRATGKFQVQPIGKRVHCDQTPHSLLFQIVKYGDNRFAGSHFNRDRLW